ncbi:MAG: hypothetical protein K6C97_05665 [Treponema sp.]|nr:hypothetical protein [Treponema sp.]
MFERMSFSFNDSWFEGTQVHIFYDETEDKTYCFYNCNIDTIYDKKCDSDNREFILDGHDLVEELEKCDFRKWYNLECPLVCDGVHFELEFNDKNKMTETRSGRNAFPDNFLVFLDVFRKYFPKTNFYEVRLGKEYYEIYDHKKRLLRTPLGWHNNKKTLKLLKKLTQYIEIFETQKNFGKWKPEPNTSKHFSSENHIKYKKSVRHFIKDIKEIADKCKDLDLYNSSDILQLLGIEEMNEDVEKYYLDNRSAMLLLMHYMNYTDRKPSDYKLEEALKNGTILKVLEFIRSFNHFDEQSDNLDEEEDDSDE